MTVLAESIRPGDYIAYIADNGSKELRHVEALWALVDGDCVHVRTWGPRFVPFRYRGPLRSSAGSVLSTRSDAAVGACVRSRSDCNR